MDIFKNVADSVAKAVDFVVDQNRKTALINRLKIVISNEKEVKARAYVALGKYYYENSRDEENGETENLCAAIDNADRRLKKAYTKLDELVRPTGAEEEEESCCCGEEPSEESAEEAGEEPSGETSSGAVPEEEGTAPVEAARNTGDGEAAEDGFPPE